MPNTQSYWILATVITVLACGFYLFGYMPQSARLDAIRSDMASVKNAIHHDSAQAERIPIIKQRVADFKMEFKDFDRQLPKQQELAGFLKEISGQDMAGQIRNQSIQPGNPSSGELYDCLPIIMNFDCGFSDLVAFLQRLDGMTRLSRVESLKITPSKDSEGDLHVAMRINIYFTES